MSASGTWKNKIIENIYINNEIALDFISQHSQTFQCINLLLGELQGHFFLWSLIRLTLHRGLVVRLPGLRRLVLDPSRMRQRYATGESEVARQLHRGLLGHGQTADPLQRRGDGSWSGSRWSVTHCWPRPRSPPSSSDKLTRARADSRRTEDSRLTSLMPQPWPHLTPSQWSDTSHSSRAQSPHTELASHHWRGCPHCPGHLRPRSSDDGLASPTSHNGPDPPSHLSVLRQGRGGLGSRWLR